MNRRPRIIIVGAGLGGLALAQSLRTSHEVMVLERDAHVLATGGYRIHLDGAATRVLERALPDDVWRLLCAVSDTGGAFAQFTLAGRRLGPILIAEESGGPRLMVQRRALRLLLTRGIESSISWGTVATGVAQDAHGASVTLADGRQIEADVVVGADGVHSVVSRSLAGAPTSHDLGLLGVAGATPMDRLDRFPRYLLHGPALALDHRGLGMFLSLSGHTVLDRAGLPSDVDRALGPASLVWGLIARTDLMSQPGQNPEELLDQTSRALAGWHRWLRREVMASDSKTVATYRFRAADPATNLTPWRPGRITALGDAVHAMPPTGGRAGATAIADAGDLAERLRFASSGAPVAASIAAFEQSMAQRARPAIRESLQPVRAIVALRHRAVSAVARPLLAAADAAGQRRYARRP